jgi:hypothetical protein
MARGLGVVGPAARGDHRGGAALGLRSLRVCRATRVGESERLPVGRADVCFGRSGRADRGAEMGAGASLPVGRAHVYTCCCRRTSGGAEKWAREHRCPWDVDTRACRAVGPSRGAAVGNGARCPYPSLAFTVVRAPVARRAPCHGSP